MVWEKGRQLKSFGSNVYTYNAAGIRTSKTVGGIKHTYTLDGAKILREQWVEGEDIKRDIVPLYDNEDNVCGILYGDIPYYFLKNLQGDVIAITNQYGETVARYTYDAWGACTISYDATATPTVEGGETINIATVNPFRYRSYYFDTETGLYYLQSRYYDPNLGRFINGDDAIIIYFGDCVIQHHLFAYCDNNAINTYDPIGFGGLAVISGVLEAILKVAYTIIYYAAIAIIVGVLLYVILKFANEINNQIKTKKDKQLATSIAVLVACSTAPVPPSPDDPDFRGKKTNSSVKLYEKGKVRVEVENMGKNPGNVHLQIKGDSHKYYYCVKDMHFYTEKEFINLAPNSIQKYLNDKKIVDAIIKGLQMYLGY